MTRLSLIMLVGLSSTCWAQKAAYDIYYGGNKSGECQSELKSSGDFTSNMTLKIGPVSVLSSMTGKVNDGLLTECQVDSTQSGVKTSITWKDGKVTVTSGSNTPVKDRPYKPAIKTVLSVFHPQLNSLLWKGLNGTPRKSKYLFVDGMAELESEITGKNQTASIGGKTVSFHMWTVSLDTLKANIAFSDDGQTLGIEIPVQKVAWVLKGYDGIFADPLAKFPELSQPTFKVRTERRVRAAMRDGTKLMADIMRPEGDGKYPTILIRTPYGRSASLLGEEWYAKRGYVVMSQDVRGRGGSDGEWDPLIHERADGKDTLDWIASQPWSDGKVGMIGGSYLGYVQWAAATTGHQALKCIVPQVSPPQPDMNFPWDHGSFMLLADLWWCRVVKDREATVANAFATMKNLGSLAQLPLTQTDDKFFGSNIDFYDKWLHRSTLADWGDVFTTEDVAKVKIPTLQISGVWDGDGIGTAMHWAARKHDHDWLVFGPWTHLFNTSHKYGDQEYGEHGVIELEPIYLRFFDTYLKGKDVGQERQPKVKYFVTGSNKWIESSDWPMPSAKARFYNFDCAKGSLSDSSGSGKKSYVYDPNKIKFQAQELQVSITGTTTVLPAPKSTDPTLFFKTDVFDRDTTISGPCKVELYVCSTGKDASFMAMVVDVDEKGVARLIGLPGTQRATYVDGKTKLLVPNQINKVTIEPWWFAHQFKTGHRLGVIVTSDMYPKFARNPGTGVPDWKATKLVKVTNTIWSDPKHPSRVSVFQMLD